MSDLRAVAQLGGAETILQKGRAMSTANPTGRGCCEQGRQELSPCGRWGKWEKTRHKHLNNTLTAHRLSQQEAETAVHAAAFLSTDPSQ